MSESGAVQPVSPARRGGGRAGRAARQGSIARTGPFRRRIPAYELLDESDLAELEAQADWILSEIGIDFRGDGEALRLFAEAGCEIEGERVRFRPGQARALCATAPASFTLHARDPACSVILGGDHLVLMPGYGSPFVTDLDRGRRYATIEDFRNFVRLAWVSPWLHHSGGTVCEPTDIPVNKRHLDMMLAHLTLSAKPFMGGVTSLSRAEDSIAMARLVFGREFMQSHAVMQANINVNSPLVYDETMTGALRAYAAANQCVCLSPAIFSGAMGPVTPAAVAAQTHAEAMAGIALVQLVRPGCPVVYGSFHNTMNLRSGALSFGSPEANLVTMALAQLARRLAVPVRSGGGQITAANSADGQAMADSTSAMWATILSGANQVWHAAGWLEGGLTMGYEKFAMDLDASGAMLRMVTGMAVNEDTLTRASYREAGPGVNFLSTAHTIQHFASANFIPDIADAGPYETWVERGRPTVVERANDRWKEMLAGYVAPPIAPQVAASLQEFVARRKAELPDEWY
ncbi:MAG: trimethylamine methyltransferase family protein [Rhodobacteraceae bacterium]|nr:trimethylamine methyltransferase family protein [Paracoccaceae bacterium]MCP5341334.1 trimethylamine methyltransferase family protein [Paracoccaceae bacterium]